MTRHWWRSHDYQHTQNHPHGKNTQYRIHDTTSATNKCDINNMSSQHATNLSNQPSYNLTAHQRAQKELSDIDEPAQSRIHSTLDTLAETERVASASGVKPLTDEGTYRVRVGDWRAIFAIRKPHLVLLAVHHRNGAYERHQLDTALDRLATFDAEH